MHAKVGGRPWGHQSRWAKHWDSCALRNSIEGCLHCKFLKNKHRWRSMLRISSTQPHLGSWLGCKIKGGTFVLGCIVCAMAKNNTTAGLFGWTSCTSALTGNFKRHAGVYLHRLAVARLLGLEPPPKRPNAPSKEAFKKVLEMARSGTPLRRGLATVGKEQKISRMKYCIAEAARKADRSFLRAARSIAIHADSRGKRYNARFSASHADLLVRKGSFGQVVHTLKGTGAVAVRRSLEDLITEFCTPLFGAPCRYKAAPPKKRKCDEALKKHIMDCIEIYDPDRAADEQCAGRNMRDDAGSFKNLKIVTYDHTHAARRQPTLRCGSTASHYSGYHGLTGTGGGEVRPAPVWPQQQV